MATGAESIAADAMVIARAGGDGGSVLRDAARRSSILAPALGGQSLTGPLPSKPVHLTPDDCSASHRLSLTTKIILTGMATIFFYYESEVGFCRMEASSLTNWQTDKLTI